MRITGGQARGIPLKTTPSIRPATDKMRQAVFSYLGETVQNAVCVDLFAGSGSYGLEALSRGAGTVNFVEANNKVIGCLRQNLKAVCRSMNRSEKSVGRITKGDAIRWSPQDIGIRLIFADPPYPRASEFIPRILKNISEWNRQNENEADFLLIIEGPGGLEYSTEGWNILRTFGKGGRGDPFLVVLQPD